MYNKKNVEFVALLCEDFMFQSDNRDIKEEHSKKPKQAKKTAKKSTTMQTTGVVIKDSPGVFVSKKKASAKVDKDKGMDLLCDVALLKATQLKKALKKSKQDTHKLYASGSGDGIGSQPKVPGESQDNITSTNERTCTIPGFPDVPKYQSKSENKSWVNSKDDDSNDDDNDDVTNDDVDSDNDDEEEEYDEEYVHTPNNYEFSDDEEYEEFYKDIKTECPIQSSYLSSDFANQFLNLDNVLPFDNEVVSMMNVKVLHEEPSTQALSFLTIPVTLIPKTSTEEFEKKSQVGKKRYIDLIEKSLKDIIKDEVNSQLPNILPKEVSDYATPVIQSTITKSLKNVVLAKCSSQPKYTYEAAASVEYEHVALASTCHRETAAAIRKSARIGRILKNLLDKVSQLH
nr:hypothetical protein [Tanacetum cinerariifolium]